MKRLMVPLVVILTLAFFVPIAVAQGSPVPSPIPVVDATPVPTVPAEPTPLPEPPAADAWTLVAILTWLMSGGSGWIVSRFFEDDKAPQWFKDLKPSRKQIVTALSSGMLALVGCLGLLALGKQTAPVGFEQWFNVLAPVFIGAPGVGELFHSRRKAVSKS